MSQMIRYDSQEAKAPATGKSSNENPVVKGVSFWATDFVYFSQNHANMEVFSFFNENTPLKWSKLSAF